MTALAELLTARRDVLLARWRAPELGALAESLLTALTEVLRPGDAASPPTPVDPRPGFDLERVLAEYAALHALVLELPAPEPLAVEDARRVADFFQRAVARAALEAVRRERSPARTGEDVQAPELQETQRWLAMQLTCGGDGVIATDALGRVTGFNPVAEQLTGWSRAEVLSRPLGDVFPAREATGAALELVARTRQLGGAALRVTQALLPRRAGASLSIELVAASTPDTAGLPGGVLLVFRDISARLEVQRRIELLAAEARRSEAELSLLLDSIPVLVSFVGADERYGRVNQAYRSWFGLTEEQLRGREVREVIGEAAYAVLGPYVRRGLAGERFSFEQHDVPYRLGGTRDVKVSFAPHRDADGQVRGYVAMLQDITQLRRLIREREVALATVWEAQALAEAERARLEALSLQLAEREQLLRLVVEGAGLSAWSMDCRTRLITADARFLDLYGLASSEPVPLAAVLERMHPEERPDTERAIEAALAGAQGGRYFNERRVRGPSGSYQWGETRAQVTFAPDGTPLMIRGVTFDITARKEAEALREEVLQRTRAESERQRLMFELAPASIAVLEGPEHRFRVANANYRQLVGGREVLGRPLAEALPETVEQGFIALLDTVRRTGEPHVGREVWLQVAQGPGTPPRSVCLDFVYQPLLDAAGRVDAIFVHAVEFTALVRAREVAQQAVRDLESLAERMRRGEARLALALAVSGTGLWELDLEKMRYTADTRFREMLGLAHDELLTLERGLTFLHPEDRARVADSLGAALAGDNGGAYAEEYRTVRREDGSYRWVSARGQASFGADGKAVHFAGTGLDVTERKNAELAQTWLLRSIADQDVFGVAVLEGPELRFTLANAGYRAFVGGRDVLGKPFLEAIPEAHGQGVDVLLLNVIRTKRAITQAETRLLVDARGQGVPEPRDYTFTWQPILEADGSVRSVLILGMDITEGVRMRERAEALAQLERQRAEFAQQLIGIVSHDLRSPLSAIRLGAATLQRRTGLDAGASRTVQRIQTSTDRAERMVRELLDFTQVRLGGGLKIERQPADLHELIRGVVQEVEEAQPGVRIHHEARGEGRGTWDEDRLQQVVQNLVTNALKYGAPGEVVSVFTEGHEDTVTLGVHNQGEPITPERQASLFQPMQRGVEGVDRQGRSVGLGLFIVRAIVEAHGGTVQLTSRAGEGTTFRILLPRGAPPEA